MVDHRDAIVEHEGSGNEKPSKIWRVYLSQFPSGPGMQFAVRTGKVHPATLHLQRHIDGRGPSRQALYQATIIQAKLEE
jgi:hypothetical protein